MSLEVPFYSPSVTTRHTTNGSLIEWSLASQMICAFLNNPNKFKVQLGNTTPPLIEPMKGFVIPRAVLEHFLSLEEVPAAGMGVFFGVRADQLASPAADQHFTMILAPIDSENNIITNANCVYDHFTPVPPYSVNNYNEVLDCE